MQSIWVIEGFEAGPQLRFYSEKQIRETLRVLERQKRVLVAQQRDLWNQERERLKELRTEKRRLEKEIDELWNRRRELRIQIWRLEWKLETISENQQREWIEMEKDRLNSLSICVRLEIDKRNEQWAELLATLIILSEGSFVACQHRSELGQRHELLTFWKRTLSKLLKSRRRFVPAKEAATGYSEGALGGSRSHCLSVDSMQIVSHRLGKLRCCNSTAICNERGRHDSKRSKRSQLLRQLNTASSEKPGVIVAEPSFPSRVCKQALFAFEWGGGSGSRRRNSHEKVQDRRLGKDSGWLCRSSC